MNGPRRKLIERYQVVGVRLGGDTATPWDMHHYEGAVDGTNVRILLLHYESHIDARLGAQGLRVAGYSILGIRDLHNGELVDDSALTKPEEAGWHL